MPIETMESNTQPYADLTGTSDVPSPQAGLRVTAGNPVRGWATDLGETIARKPEYLLAAAALAGFVAGRMVKRLLF